MSDFSTCFSQLHEAKRYFRNNQSDEGYQAFNKAVEADPKLGRDSVKAKVFWWLYNQKPKPIDNYGEYRFYGRTVNQIEYSSTKEDKIDAIKAYLDLKKTTPEYIAYRSERPYFYLRKASLCFKAGEVERAEKAFRKVCSDPLSENQQNVYLRMAQLRGCSGNVSIGKKYFHDCEIPSSEKAAAINSHLNIREEEAQVLATPVDPISVMGTETPSQSPEPVVQPLMTEVDRNRVTLGDHASRLWSKVVSLYGFISKGLSLGYEEIISFFWIDLEGVPSAPVSEDFSKWGSLTQKDFENLEADCRTNGYTNQQVVEEYMAKAEQGNPYAARRLRQIFHKGLLDQALNLELAVQYGQQVTDAGLTWSYPK